MRRTQVSRGDQGGADAAADLTIPEQGAWLRQVVKGFFAYHAVPTNIAALAAFRDHVTRRRSGAAANGTRQRGNDAQDRPHFGLKKSTGRADRRVRLGLMQKCM
jgi:hypothetical protein